MHVTVLFQHRTIWNRSKSSCGSHCTLWRQRGSSTHCRITGAGVTAWRSQPTWHLDCQLQQTSNCSVSLFFPLISYLKGCKRKTDELNCADRNPNEKFALPPKYRQKYPNFYITSQISECSFHPFSVNFTGDSWLILVMKILQGICLRGV